MTRPGLVLAWVGVVGGLLSGCSGVLTLEQQSSAWIPCVTSASCGGGEVCAVGTCAPTVNWGDCDAALGCSAGECLAIVVGTNDCAPTRPSGLCDAGELCVGGACVPLDSTNRCSATLPNGLCPCGAACVDGACVDPNDEHVSCSAERSTGLCEPGYACDGDSCEAVACSVDHPYDGTCAVDQMCSNGSCEDVPCSPEHLGGTCSGLTFCSAIGNCIPNGSCDVVADCEEAHHLCIDSACEPDLSCASDPDCAIWPATPHCVVSQSTCDATGVCVENIDCATGEKCAVAGVCIPETECFDDQDCASGDYCGDSKHCLTPTVDNNQCYDASDCAPGYICNTTLDPYACEVDTTTPPCTTNDVTTEQTGNGCTATDLYCCPTGETCCLDGAGKVDPTQRCELTDGVCVPTGSCVVDADCLDTAFFCAYDHTCQPKPTSACTTVNDCVGTDICSVGGACVADGQCTGNTDCLSGVEFCGTDFYCHPLGCGFTTGSAAAIKPNMLIVLDRSGSMQISRGYASNPTTGANQYCGGAGDGISCEVYPDCGSKTTQSDCLHYSYTECASTYGAAACDSDTMYYLESVLPCSWTGSACEPNCPSIGDATTCDATSGCTWSTGINGCIVDRPATRWEQALEAINTITGQYGTSLSFGLSTYPEACNADQCTLLGNWASCDGKSCNTVVDCGLYTTAATCLADNSCRWSGVCTQGSNCQAGRADVPVGTGDVVGTLANIFPGGGTPTAPTLRNVRDNRASFGVSEGISCGSFADAATCLDPRCYWDGGACVSHCVDPAYQTQADCGLLTDCIWDAPSTSCLKQQDVGDYVLLVTDGEANCDDDCATALDATSCTALGQGCEWYVPPVGVAKCQMASSSTWYADQVNGALDDLLALAPTVKTYVVGFALAGVSQNLNCHAAHGGTARADTCTGVTASNCNNSFCSGLTLAQCDTFAQCSWTGSACEPNACYYDAGDSTALLSALNDIVGTVALCSITVDGVRSTDSTTLSLLHVYLDSPSGQEELMRDANPADGNSTWVWDLTDTYVRINFGTAACDLIKAGAVSPLVVIACDVSPG